MTATLPPSPDTSIAAAGAPAFHAMTRKWSAIHQAAGVVAALAGMPGDPDAAGQKRFLTALQAAGGWRLALATQGIDDLAAVMEPGLAALLSIHRRGAEPAVAAEALWEEFQAAREALLGLEPPR